MNTTKRKLKAALAVTCIALLGVAGCSKKHVPVIKANAVATWRQAGFEIIGYEGYEYGSMGQWGGAVWYIVKKVPDNGITYRGSLSKWGDEYHIYSLSAIDALKGGK